MAFVVETVKFLYNINGDIIAYILSGCYFLHLGIIIRSDHHVIQSSLHVLSLSYGQPFTLQVVVFMVLTYVLHV